MKTNFFSQITALQLTGDIHLILKQGTNDTWGVSVLLKNETCGDKAKNIIPPLVLNGSTEELDRGFFENIAKPLQDTSGLMVNMENYLKQQVEAKKQSVMEKAKVEKEKKEKDAKECKYKEALQQADALEKEGKFREAWSKVPNPQNYPEHAETLKKRRRELSQKFAPDLFDTTGDDKPEKNDQKKKKASKV